MIPPIGITGITATFGDITKHIDAYGTLSPTWESTVLSYALLPFSIPLAWNPAIQVSRLRCHRLLVPVVDSIFQTIVQDGLRETVTSFGGCFEYRSQRTGHKLSTHAWGIALDLNPKDNQQGTDGNMDPRLVALFKSAGFEWGGDWAGRVKDPMHYQFCSGY